MANIAKKQATWVLPLVLALIAGTLVYLKITSIHGKVPVVVARKSITQGTSISESVVPSSEYFEVAKVAREDVPANSFRNIDELYAGGLMAVRYIPSGRKLARDVDLKPEVLPVPPGMLAVTVPVDAVSGVAGFLQPGDFVDVLATVKSGEQGAQTETILRRKQVLAVGTRAGGAPTGMMQKAGVNGEAKPEITVQPNATLAVLPDEAQTLTLYDSLGKLRLAKRNPSDTETLQLAEKRYPPPRAERTATPQTAAYQPAPAQPMLPGSGIAPVAEPSTVKLVIYRGTERQEVEVAKEVAK